MADQSNEMKFVNYIVQVDGKGYVCVRTYPVISGFASPNCSECEMMIPGSEDPRI